MSASLLTLLQMASPGFPVGSFAFSHGLEAAIASGELRDGNAEDWIADCLGFAAGRVDAWCLAAAWHGEDGADDLARALAPTSERLEESLSQGRAFARLASSVFGHEAEAAAYPVAFGRAAATEGIALGEALQAYLFAYAGMLVSAAVRFVPLGETEGQRILASLAPRIVALADEMAGAEAPPVSAAFASDRAAIMHETLQPRIYRT